MATADPTEATPSLGIISAFATSVMSSSSHKQANAAENKGRNILHRLSLVHPSTSTNYISLAIGYGRQAVHPAINQWAAWTPMQRVTAICILLPVLAAPLMTIAFLAPWVVCACIGGYVALFGLETSAQHYNEAVKEHFGASSLTLESFRQRADELKQRAEGSGHVFVQRLLHIISLSVSQVLVVVVFVLDYIIAVRSSFFPSNLITRLLQVLVKASQAVTRQRQHVAGYKHRLDKGERHHHSRKNNNNNDNNSD
jgi:hypothetical protein